MSRRPSIIYEACTRFDGLKAIGVSRHVHKRRLRAEMDTRGAAPPWGAISTGRIHADKTLDTYKGIALRYVHWARTRHGVGRLADLDAEAERLVTLYLAERTAAGDSPYTLKTIRSALRMFHRPGFPAGEREARVRGLGDRIALPVRRRAASTRSRGTVAMDREIALDRYREIVAFCRATGLRRRELEALTVGAVRAGENGDLVVEVSNGKGGKERTVPVLPGREEAVLALVIGRSPEERVVPHIAVRLDLASYRRQYAQDLYSEGGKRLLPSPMGRLKPGSIDVERALYVARALGHERVDVVVRHYLR